MNDNRIELKANGSTPIKKDFTLKSGSVSVTAAFENGFCKKIDLLSQSDEEIFVLNTFENDLIGVSDKVSADKFGAFVQKLQECKPGEYIKVKLEKGGDFTIIDVL